MFPYYIIVTVGAFTTRTTLWSRDYVAHARAATLAGDRHSSCLPAKRIVLSISIFDRKGAAASGNLGVMDRMCISFEKSVT